MEEGDGTDDHDETAYGNQPPPIEDPSPQTAADFWDHSQHHEADTNGHDKQAGERHVISEPKS